MNKKPSTSTILLLIFLLAAVALTTYLVLQRTIFQSEAGATEEPKFITVTNEREDGFTIAWITTKDTQGTVKLINENLTFAESEMGKTHIIEIDGLDSGSVYKFSITSGAEFDDNEGIGYEAYTTKVEPRSENKLFFGRIFGKDSTTPLKEGFITMQSEVNGDISNKIISRLNEQGGWQMDKSALMSTDLTREFNVSKSALVTLGIFSPEITDPVYRTYELTLAETLQIPDIFLGEDVPWELPAIEDETITAKE